MSNTMLDIGVDVGSVGAKVVVMDREGAILKDVYRRTQGRPVQTTIQILEELIGEYARQLKGIVFTGSAGKLMARAMDAAFVNEIVAQARAEAEYYPHVRTIIEVGGEESKLIQLKEDNGRIVIDDFAMNSICAAGTGSFLDQQASRIGIDIEGEFGELAMKSETPPRIAGRCTVFAKSDMIHLQQKATPVWDIIAGLCFALARNFKSNLARGRDFVKPIAFQGGVSCNAGVVRAFTEILELEPGELVIPEHRTAMGAIGAVLSLRDSLKDSPFAGVEPLRAFLREKPPASRHHPRLPAFGRPAYPEIDLSKVVAPGEKLDVYVGIDIGSISTNVVAIDRNKRLLAKEYLMTASRPIEAVRTGLRSIGEKIARFANVRGVGTTGSGRYLIGDFVGADCVRNEITAQAIAAIDIDPQVDTIFEIGGQDSKYISVDNGVVVDFQMNHVCAAGTGSFLEEQAEKLGIQIKGEFGRLALACESPVRLGERCTVFMESDVVQQQVNGAQIDQLVAGLCYSIVHNYLNRVVGSRRVGNRIFFQGGTAFNDGVVAAFEAVTGKKIIVPPNHEVTGAIGSAILALNEQTAKGVDHASAFRGFDLTERRYTQRRFQCADCPNACEINEVVIEGETPLYYGSRCDKYNLRKEKLSKPVEKSLFALRDEFLLACTKTKSAKPPRRGRVGIPRALVFHEMLPFWWTLLRELGYECVLSPPTNRRIIQRGCEVVGTETCFPVKVAHGHVLELFDKDVDYIFMPSVISSKVEFEGQENSCLCPFVQTMPYVILSALDFPPSVKPMVFPADFQEGRGHIRRTFAEHGRRYGWKRSEIRNALAKAEEAQQTFRASCREAGRKALAELRPDDHPVVIIARPYNGCDMGVNLALPRKLAALNMKPFPLDFLPLEEVPLSREFDNMFWRYGQKIMATAAYVRRHPQLTAVYITNFSCGPDSFLTTFFRKAMGEKPGLLLEIDEHSADAGVITRLEAFLDSLKGAADRLVSQGELPARNAVRSDGRKIYIPYMCEHARPMAAAFRSCGINAEVLPPSDEESLELGRRYTTGKECLPAIVTAGDMVRKVFSEDFDRDRAAFFMPSGTGPCRFGQYNRLHRYILKEIGYEDVPVISPNQGQSFYDDFRNLEKDPTRVAWQGIVLADLMIRALHRVRPYEENAGEAERVFRTGIDRICETIERSGDLSKLAGELSGSMKAIPLRDEDRPLVGVVGEIYVRSHAFSNADIIRTLEAMGAEVDLAGFIEWIYYTNYVRIRRNRWQRDFISSVKNIFKQWVQKSDERRLAAPFAGVLRESVEIPTQDILNEAAPYIHDTFEGECVLTVGKSVNFYRHHASGVVNVMPFTCMPGNICSALLKRVREDHDQLPVVSLAYDGQNLGGTVTRLEAFMHQVKEFHRRRHGEGRALEASTAAG